VEARITRDGEAPVNPSAEREGTLIPSGFPQILARLCRDRVTGVLRLSQEELTKSVFLNGGRIVFASSQDPADRLGDLLIARGLITPAQCAEAARQLRPGKRLGTILVELGFLPAADLPRWVLEQVREILFSLFPWDEGTFHLTPGPLPAAEVITLRLSTLEVFLRGARRIEKWSVLRPSAEAIRIPYRLTGRHQEFLKDTALHEDERSLLSLLQEEEQMTLEKASVSSGLPTLVVYQIFFALRTLGLLEEVQVAPPGVSAAQHNRGETAAAGGAAAAPTQEPDPGATIRFAAPLSLLREPRSVAPPAPEPPAATSPEGNRTANAPPGPTADPAVQPVILKSAALPSIPAERGGGAPPRSEPTEAPPPRASGNVSVPPVPAPARKPEYRVVRVEGDKLDGSGVQHIEEILGTWSRKGYRLAGVVQGRGSGFFGAAAPSFFVFTRD
jgi:Domain of unknown function (DUF4388)